MEHGARASKLTDPPTAGGTPQPQWETLFWTVFAASDNPMAIVEANRRVASANGALQRLLDRAEEEVVGHAIDDVLPAGDRRLIGDRWHAMLARGEGHGRQDLELSSGSIESTSYAAQVAHVGGRLIVLLVLMVGPDVESAEGETDAEPAALTARELEIVGRVALGATSREIADALFVTPETVRTHVRNAMAKTGTRTRAHLVAAVICRGLVPEISSR